MSENKRKAAPHTVRAHKNYKAEIANVGFNPDSYAEEAPEEKPSFNPDAYLKENPSYARAQGARGYIDPMAAMALGYADAPTFGGASALAKKVEGLVGGDPAYFDYLQKEYPIQYGVGSLPGAFAKYSPANMAFNAIESGVKAIPNAISKAVTPAFKAIEGNGRFGGYAEMTGKAVKPLVDLLGFGARVPVTAGIQSATSAAARDGFEGKFSGPEILKSGIEGATNPWSTMPLYALQGAGALSRMSQLGKRIYASGSPISSKDVGRAREKGQDLIQDAMDLGISGTYGQQAKKSKAVMEDAHKLRQDMVNAANSGQPVSVRRGDVLGGVDDLIFENLDAGGEPQIAEQYLKTKVLMGNTMPRDMGPRELEDFLMKQKNYIRQRKGESGAAGVFDSRSASPGSLEARRAALRQGTDLQAKQMSAISPGKGEYFRELGQQYGTAASAKRGADQSRDKNWGNMNSLYSALATTGGRGVDYLSNKAISPQAVATMIRELVRQQQEETPQ